MNDGRRTFAATIEAAFIEWLPHILVAAVSASVSGGLLLGALYWDIRNDLGDLQHTTEIASICRQARGCPWHRDTESAISRLEQHIASGAFVRETVRLNAQKIDALARDIYLGKGATKGK